MKLDSKYTNNLVNDLIKFIVSTKNILKWLTTIKKKSILMSKEVKKMRSQIINILKENKGKLISGSDIAKRLNITRSYVSKAIKELQTEGYDIQAENRAGYIYQNDIKVLKVESIKKNLTADFDVIILDEVDSTNKYLKDFAKNSTLNNILVVANKQTGGRGRLGRTFVSNKASGIYMSLLVRPNIPINLVKKVTCMVSVATVNAIDKLANTSTSIKWVNDVYLNKKKICGILTEGVALAEQNVMEYIVIGIGVNCYHQEFDEELSKKATSLENELNITISRNELISEITNQISYYLNDFEKLSKEFMKEYIDKSFIIGMNVELQKGNTTSLVKVVNINDKGELIVEDENHQIINYSSGEITRMIIK